jgi:hypothetical protein
MRERLSRALPASLVVYASTALCALAAALPLAARVTTPVESEPQTVELLLVVVRLYYAATGAAAQLGALPLLVTALGAPLLRSLWLQALLRPAPLQQHAAAAIRGYRQALAACAVCAGLFVLAAALTCLGGGVTWLVLGWTGNLALQALLALAVVVTGLLACALVAPTLADVALLQLALGEPRAEAALFIGWAFIDRRLLRARAGLAAVELTLTAAALSARVWLGSSTGVTAADLLLGQLLMFATIGARAVWLAYLVEQTAPTFEAAQVT